MVKLRDKYGTVTDFDQRYAKILLKLGKHKLVKEAASQPTPAPAVETAEAPPPDPAVAMTSESELVPKPRRTYRRRDMQADD